MKEKEEWTMKDVELKLISELMKNSRRSDRELAKATGVSQPTISRTIKKLEKEGYVKEYTMIPNFHKLGYEIMALTFFRLRRDVQDRKELERIVRTATETALKSQSALEVIMVERGMGFDSGVIIVSFHEDYSAYQSFRQWVNQFDFIEVDEVKSFLINLHDEIHYRPLTFATLAQHLPTIKKALSHERY
jgi:DNA-binding Lrp family transcriptional regulator